MSKLKQDAYRAGKKRDWATAISIYKQILEMDKHNPALINELGDIYLKQGIIPTAIDYFLTAASKYRQTGLKNNALAIYKKILRYDAENLNAHWYLAEIRAGQGLTVEGEVHALRFLDASDSISSEIREIYLKRCVQVLALYKSNSDVLQKLSDVFDFWDMDIERARAICLVSCRKFLSGEEDEARAEMNELLKTQAEIANYTEYAQWREQTGEGHRSEVFNEDVNALSLDGNEPTGTEVSMNGPADLNNEAEPAAATVADEADFSDIALPSPSEESDAAIAAAPEPVAAKATEGEDLSAVDDEGCFSIDPDEEASFFDVLGDDSTEQSEAEVSAPPTSPMADEAADEKDGIDLLAEILGDEESNPAAAAAGQLDTIVNEIGAQVVGEALDPVQAYDMGMVYLEMGILEQACDCFETATTDSDFAVRAFEMWGIALQRGGRYEDSLDVLERGLEVGVENKREKLGLLYHMGRAFERSGVPEEALLCYEQVNQTMPDFLDVQERLEALSQPGLSN